MLSRNAQGLYWLGRYLERAEHLCRLLRLQVEALVDRPIREIHFGWSRIYVSLNRHPSGGRLELLGDEEDDPLGDSYTLADFYTLADDLTFERSNPDSVFSCFAMGRENARQMRNRISAEMWSCLNRAYLRLQDMTIQKIWEVSPENFYVATARDIDTFNGVAEVTMYRDEGWRFWRLGRSIERAQSSAGLFLAQMNAGRRIDSSLGEDWTGLLRFCQAFDVYNRKYSVDVQPDQVLDLLVTDPHLPGSLFRSLNAAVMELDAIGPGPIAESGAQARRLAGRLRALIHYAWGDREDHESLLQWIGENCRKLHELVIAAYVDYPIEDSPLR